MLNIMEVSETNSMIEQEKLDVRTITMGINLLDCADASVQKVCENVYNKITRIAKDLVSTGCAIERDYGIPIVNKRITVTPISLVGACVQKPRRFCANCARARQSSKKSWSGFNRRILSAACKIYDNSRPHAYRIIAKSLE